MFYNCLINNHDLQKCQIENIEYKFCKHCKYTEKRVYDGWVKTERIYNKDVKFS